MGQPLIKTTEFQLYIEDTNNIVDFTEYKITRMIQKATAKKKLELIKILNDYKNGRVAISWKGHILSYKPIFKATKH